MAWSACCVVPLAAMLAAQGPGDSGARPAAGALRRFEFTETHMGSPFQVVLYTTDEAAARRASRSAFDRIARLDAALSDYEPESELMRLCDRSGGPPVAVSPDLFDVLERSLAMSERSDGAFDVSVGPVVRLWRRARRTRALPEADTLARARRLVGYRAITLDRDHRTVQLARKGMKLDLGGIAKGYAAGAALATLKAEHGIKHALVAGAGDIVVGAAPPGEAGWTIGIAPLEAPGSAPPSHFLRLADRAVSTSGDAERFVEIGGKRYSHIVDPRTGLGLVDRMSVTIVADDGATADSLATAVCVLGPARGLELVESIDGAAALIVRRKDGAAETIESARWKTLPTASYRPVTSSPPQGSLRGTARP